MSVFVGCSAVAGLMEDYLDDLLPPPMRQVVRAHLTTCRACSHTLAGWTGTRRWLTGLPRVDMPREMKDRLLYLFRSTPVSLPYQSATDRYSTGAAS